MRPIIFSLDCTSTGWTALGLTQGEERRGEFNGELGRSQATLLPCLVKSFLELYGLTVKEIDFFAVTVGPGSFTGIKVGMAFVQFLAWSLGKKVIPLSSLEARAFAAGKIPGMHVCPVLRAGGEKIYSALYRWEGSSVPPSKVVPEGVYTGTELTEAMLPLAVKEPCFITDFPRSPSGFFPLEEHLLNRTYTSGASNSALAYLYREKAIDPADLEPRYLKEPDTGK